MKSRKDNQKPDLKFSELLQILKTQDKPSQAKCGVHIDVIGCILQHYSAFPDETTKKRLMDSELYEMIYNEIQKYQQQNMSDENILNHIFPGKAFDGNVEIPPKKELKPEELKEEIKKTLEIFFSNRKEQGLPCDVKTDDHRIVSAIARILSVKTNQVLTSFKSKINLDEYRKIKSKYFPPKNMKEEQDEKGKEQSKEKVVRIIDGKKGDGIEKGNIIYTKRKEGSTAQQTQSAKFVSANKKAKVETALIKEKIEKESADQTEENTYLDGFSIFNKEEQIDSAEERKAISELILDPIPPEDFRFS